jgi:hypothetical protein
MQKVEGSNPFIRSISSSQGDVAEWLGTGLQNPLHRFNSGRRLLTSPPRDVSSDALVRTRASSRGPVEPAATKGCGSEQRICLEHGCTG